MIVRSFILLITVVFIQVSVAAPRVIKNGNKLYLSNTLVVKLKTEPLTDAFGSVNASVLFPYEMTALGIRNAVKTFTAVDAVTNSGIEKIVTLQFEDGTDPEILASKFFRYSYVEYAEPKFVYEPVYTPNDPSLGSQYSLSKINAAGGWDVTKGDTSVVIGIVDTGVDWDHPDLFANVKMNWNEIPNNNIDDDNNGYVDDFRGWDFGGLTGTPDGDPVEDQPDHGTHVAGIASAVTDNGRGIASIGFKCKLLAVKTSQDNNRNPFGQPYIVFGYEGIVYAANRGAKVINCSWGGGGYSLTGQAVIKYATQKGALVVCAAGNDNSSAAFFPASFDGVLSVASTDASDRKSSFSNYGTNVDVSSPGSSIYSTWMNDTYTNNSGTSMASPLVAGLAGLVAARFPAYKPLQIGEQIRATGDNIDNLNSGFANLLGRGRINAQKAVSTTNAFALRAENVVFSDAGTGDGDGIFEPNEVLNISLKVRNYLAPTASLTVGLESKSTYAAVLQGTKVVGVLNTLDSLVSATPLYTFRIASTVPANTELQFLINFVDGTNLDYQWISVVVNPTFATQNVNNIAMTITSDGKLGFNDFTNNQQGQGFRYNNNLNNLYEGALMLATSATKISSAARSAAGNTQDNHFSVVQPFIIKTPGTVADQEGSAIFNDNNAGTGKVGTTVKLQSYSFTGSADANYILLRYKIANTSGAVINNLFAGIFCDWDMVDGSGADDVASWDTVGQYGYVFHTGGDPTHFVGVASLGSGAKGYYAINNNGGDGGFSIYDGFTFAEKFQAMSGGILKPRAGAGDISSVVSSGPYSIAVGDTLQIGFAFAAGPDRQALSQTIASARIKYQSILTSVDENSVVPLQFNVEQNFPNPFNPSTVLSFTVPETGLVNITVYNTLGKKVAVLTNNVYTSGRHNIPFNAGGLPSGVYFAKVETGGVVKTIKMLLQK